MNQVKAEVKCRHCSRFLANATQSAVMELKCSNSKCKKLDTYKVVFMSDMIKNGHSHEEKKK
jgi:phage FluMu protein Com